MSTWTHEFPVYVSRKTADGLIYKFTYPMWMVLLMGLLFLVNALLWGGIGIYKAIEVIA